ncbi:MAG TPA: hypothetical protein VFN05_02230, partial [Actinomycetes bacterium]|nr:hypothetical protein [Actinomycetes bacterium]
EGTWRYAVTPVLGGWTGTEGPRTAVGIEAAAAVTVTSPEDGGATRDSGRPSPGRQPPGLATPPRSG